MSAADDLADLELTEAECSTQLWMRISANLNARLHMLRAKNDNALSADETAALRGRIAELKKLLAAGVSQD